MFGKKRRESEQHLLAATKEFKDAADQITKPWTDNMIDRFINESFLGIAFGENRELDARTALANFYAAIDEDIYQLKAEVRVSLSASRLRFMKIGHPELFEIFLTNQIENAWRTLVDSTAKVADGTIAMSAQMAKMAQGSR